MLECDEMAVALRSLSRVKGIQVSENLRRKLESERFLLLKLHIKLGLK